MKLVKSTVNLTEDAHKAWIASSERTGHTRTDTVNRALQIYDSLTEAFAETGESKLTVFETSGGVVGSMTVRPPESRWKPSWVRRLLGSMPNASVHRVPDTSEAQRESRRRAGEDT